MSFFDDNFFDLSSAITVPFKRYRGMTLLEVARIDADYLRWAQRATDFGANHYDAINNALRAVRQEYSEAAPLDLTPHQQEVSDTLIDAALNKGHHIIRLEGGAGYGKSYVTQDLAEKLMDAGYTVRAMAVSYVATEVLREQLEPRMVECGTVARTMRFQKRWENGKEIYEHSDETIPQLRGHDKSYYDRAGNLQEEYVPGLLEKRNALIVDECSMIHDRDANALYNTIEFFLEEPYRTPGLLILVGDSRQLPPVKQENLSRCCLEAETVATLTKPMRYSEDSQLYLVEQSLRDDPWGLRQFLNGPQVSRCGTLGSMVEEYVGNYRNDLDALHRMMLFRRRDVVNANNMIRTELFGPDPAIVEEDERLMVLATTDYPSKQTKDQITHRLYSGTQFRVSDREEELYEIEINGQSFSIPCWMVKRSNEQEDWIRIVFGVTETQMDLDKRGAREFQAALSAAIEEANRIKEENAAFEAQHGRRPDPCPDPWETYKKLQSDFVRVAYTYATSVHRAQGQTCDYAYCSPFSLLQIPGLMGRALAYVAGTRARKHLTVIG